MFGGSKRDANRINQLMLYLTKMLELFAFSLYGNANSIFRRQFRIISHYMVNQVFREF